MIKFIVRTLVFAFTFVLIMGGQYAVFATFAAQSGDINQIGFNTSVESEQVSYVDPITFAVEDVINNFDTPKIGIRSRWPNWLQWGAVACDTVWNTVESAKTIVAPIIQAEHLAEYRALNLKSSAPYVGADGIISITGEKIDFTEMVSDQHTIMYSDIYKVSGKELWYINAEAMFYDSVLKYCFSDYKKASASDINVKRLRAGQCSAIKLSAEASDVTFPFYDGVTQISIRGTVYTFITSDYNALIKKYFNYSDTSGVDIPSFNTAFYKYCDFNKFNGSKYDRYTNHYLKAIDVNGNSNSSDKTKKLIEKKDGFYVIGDHSVKYDVKSNVAFAYFEYIIGLIFTIVLVMQMPIVFKKSSTGVGTEVEGVNLPVIGYAKAKHDLHKHNKEVRNRKKAAKAERKLAKINRDANNQ